MKLKAWNKERDGTKKGEYRLGIEKTYILTVYIEKNDLTPRGAGGVYLYKYININLFTEEKV